VHLVLPLALVDQIVAMAAQEVAPWSVKDRYPPTAGCSKTDGGRFMAGRALRPVRDSFERQRIFIADASHELKTPLTLIRADAEMVLYRDSLNEQDRKLMEHALGETDRMGEVLSDLLLVARLDAGKLEVARKPFDLVGVLKEEAERFGPRAAGNDVRLEVEASGELPILGDTRRKAQILAVLLDSAVRFAHPGGSILVRGRLRDRWAEVSVTDTGPGITLQHLSRVFDRFYRAESARTRGETGGGSGLGLSIARDLARVQGGDITAEGTEGRGATFRLRLPKGEALTRARDP
jgi:signal transduction histidine kinase